MAPRGKTVVWRMSDASAEAALDDVTDDAAGAFALPSASAAIESVAPATTAARAADDICPPFP